MTSKTQVLKKNDVPEIIRAERVVVDPGETIDIKRNDDEYLVVICLSGAANFKKKGEKRGYFVNSTAAQNISSWEGNYFEIEVIPGVKETCKVLILHLKQISKV